MRIHRYAFVVLVVVASTLLLGCKEEGVQHYRVARTESPPKRPFEYQLPEGWREQFTQNQMALASFSIDANGKRADVTVTRFPGRAGGLVDNINRWRGQLELPPQTDEQLKPDLKDVAVGDSTGKLVEIVGADKAGEPRQEILGVVVVRGEQTWFFKMKGPADLVVQQKAAFEQFVKSVTFNDAKGSEGG